MADNCASPDLEYFDFDFSNDTLVSCILCRDHFDVTFDYQPLLKHLLMNHHFVIDSPDEIADFRQYILYWSKLKLTLLEDYCITYITNSEPDAKHLPETYYLLSDRLPEDKKLRTTIREMKLKYLTKQKEEECKDKSFSRKCIYCHLEISGGVSNCFHHLAFDHGFSLGNPDNIVFGTKLLDILEEKLQRLQCLYCEKTFKNHIILREHMRKKLHRSLNPKNKLYDKFYFLSYLKPGVPWEEAKKVIQEESDSQYINFETESTSDDDNYWTDWREDSDISATCLFCPFVTSQIPSGLLYHMFNCHQFNFEVVTNHLSFYSKVKIVNFIRAKVRLNECINCRYTFDSNTDLLLHLKSSNHLYLPDASMWDHPQYMIPVDENDGLLFHLEDKDVIDDDSSSISSLADEEIIFPEEVCVMASNSVLGNKRLREEISIGSNKEKNYAYQCFFCSFAKFGIEAKILCINHMNSMHNFDYKAMIQTFSSSAVADCINYIRLMTINKQCFVCQKSFLKKCALEEHRILEEHTFIPPNFVFENYKSLCLQTSLETDAFLMDGSII